MFGILKTEEKLKDQLQLSSKDLKADCKKCKKEEEDWSSIFIKKRENWMNLKKASDKALARRAQSSRNSVQFNLKIFWEHLPKMLLKKLFQVWFPHRVVSVY